MSNTHICKSRAGQSESVPCAHDSNCFWSRYHLWFPCDKKFLQRSFSPYHAVSSKSMNEPSILCACYPLNMDQNGSYLEFPMSFHMEAPWVPLLNKIEHHGGSCLSFGWVHCQCANSQDGWNGIGTYKVWFEQEYWKLKDKRFFGFFGMQRVKLMNFSPTFTRAIPVAEF